MNTKDKLIRSALGALLLPLAWVVPAHSQTAANSPASSSSADEELVRLPQFDVTSTAADPYRPAETLSINRTAGSIMDSPFTVNVVTPELINDIGSNSAFDVNRYFSGMSAGRGTGAGGIMDRQDFRGFESFSKTVDNFSSFLLPVGSGYEATFDPAFMERVELVMGPDSILSPTGTPGGSVNIITKSPQFKQGTDISAEVGNYNAQKFVVDTTGPIADSKHWAYRAIASIQDTKTFVPGTLKQYNGSVQLEYAFSPTAKITVKYFGEQWGLYGAISNTNDNGELVYTPDTVGGSQLSNTPQPGFTYKGSNGNADWSQRIDRLNMAQMELTAALGEHINMRLGAQIMYDNFDQFEAYPKSTPSETFNASTGQVTTVTAINPASVTIVGLYGHAENREIQLQNDFAGDFHVGGVSLQPVVGWATQAGLQSTNFVVQNNNQTDLPPANLYPGSYNPPVPPVADFTTFSLNAPESGNLFQGYAVLRAGFWQDRIFVMAGASEITANVNDYSLKGVYVPAIGQVGAAPNSALYKQDFTFQNTGNAIAPTQADTRGTYIAGLLFKPLPNISIYGSASTNAGIAATNPLWQAGKQLEFGFKSEFFQQRLQFSAAHFQINQSNISTNNPLFNTGQSTVNVLLSNETNHGEEFNLVGGITPNLSVIASFTDMRLRDPLGRRIRNIPDTMASLLLNYHFRAGALARSNLFVGVLHEGDVAGENESGITSLGVPEQPGFYLAPWTVANAGAGYTLGRYRFNLNVDNALNSQFWWQPASRISVSAYPGTTVRFTTTVHF